MLNKSAIRLNDNEVLKNELELSPKQWSQMSEMIAKADHSNEIQLGDRLEFRLSRMDEHKFSALLAKDSLDVFHFMWTEVEGVIDIYHRIVQPGYRGQGIASKIMSSLFERARYLADLKQHPYMLSLGTNQLSVVRLAEKVGLKLVEGNEANEALISNQHDYSVDGNSFVTDPQGNRVNFRLSQLLWPAPAQVINQMNSFRGIITNILQDNQQKAA